ncbi:MAG TPA: hypothetical protein VGG04_00835 [Candidatus Sulfotelmatobacter sp.]
MKRYALVLMVGFCASLVSLSCGGYHSNSNTTTSGSKLTERVLASESVTTSIVFGGLVIINGQNDTLPPANRLSAGASPGLMALSPTRNIVASFDGSSNTVFTFDTTSENNIGSVRILGPTSSMVVPLASPIVYAAVPSATVTGFTFQGAIQALNFSTGSSTAIAVGNAQTVVASSSGSQLLVFSNDSDSMTLISPGLASPPVDTSCYTNPNNGVCTIVPGFDRPVFAIVNGTTAYVLNCGAQCGGTQASVAIFDLNSLTITNTIPVDAATWALLSGSTLYVAGTSPSPANNTCAPQTTAATICGRLDIVDLGSNTVTASAVITDGYHDRMDMTTNGQLFIGSHDCTNIGNVNTPSGEVRGCLSIYHTADGSVFVPPDNGDVNGLQGFTTRTVEYVAQGGNLRVYDITKDILLINDFLPEGTINIVGYIGDVKAIDYF